MAPSVMQRSRGQRMVKAAHLHLVHARPPIVHPPIPGAPGTAAAAVVAAAAALPASTLVARGKVRMVK